MCAACVGPALLLEVRGMEGAGKDDTRQGLLKREGISREPVCVTFFRSCKQMVIGKGVYRGLR
jgi:hypothetical protein